ncbi:DNA sulfur modification protein DndE [Nonomuraea turkmeniaca]|uniref:DNA sulfur modification protein DndE n=2 Tax=Nonomuraea turkmeniaca TaxID=103838 RepID=A0A5S4FPL7_9ACTN|nr:DNA sulfur modification protein DndE [Nonomuraea turkmeniaca]
MVRFGSDVRDHLTTLKRRTNVQTSNVLCRWALCRSLAEPIAPSNLPASDTAVEMTWKVFSGTAGDLYWWLLKMRCYQLSLPLDEATLQTQIRAHVARGAAYLVGDASMRNASSLASLALVSID